MKILNIQLSLFEEVPTTIRGGGTVQYEAQQTDTGQIQSGIQKWELPLRMRAMRKGFPAERQQIQNGI